MTDPISKPIAPAKTQTVVVHPGWATHALKYQVAAVVGLTKAEYEKLTGQPLEGIPEVPQEAFEAYDSEDIAKGVSTGIIMLPETNWFYRAISQQDLESLNLGKGLTPVKGTKPSPPASAMEGTYRHLSPQGNVPTVGTDRISTAENLEAFKGILKDRGAGELVRVDATMARKLGSRFLTHDEILKHLDEFEKAVNEELAKAKASGRGKNAIARIEERLRKLNAGREYAIKFRENQSIGGIPQKAISKVKGSSLAKAAANEQLFLSGIKFLRFAGRVLMVVGVIDSVITIASASPDQRVRAAAKEAGGWAFSIAGAKAGVVLGGAAGAALGFETGPGAIVAMAIGGIIGGGVGFIAGREAVESFYDDVERAVEDTKRSFHNVGEMLRNPTQMIEPALWMFGSDEARREYYELREMETGEPPPWEGF